ncbi:hypothetical protein Tco_1124408 [Tanacetum coccineum]|uniref:Uncharacterized protein n=1 Tax=Tanacetum coccineum TaxID=301880 RepID=A0ABQ5J8V3_9ASTR
MTGEDEFHDDNPPPPPPVTPTQLALHTLSTIKLPILKKGEYDIWAMKMEHYLGHKVYPLWEIHTNGIWSSTSLIRHKWTNKEDHLAKFHKMTDAKEMWEAIKSRFGGNDESKMFQSLLSQLEIHGARRVSTGRCTQKFLRSLPASWSQVSLIMRTKPGVDNLSFDDLNNNLRVFEPDVIRLTGYQIVHRLSLCSSSYTDELKYSFFANQSSGPQLDHEDLETGESTAFDAREDCFDKTKVECFNYHNTWHFARECRSKGNQEGRRRDTGNIGYKAKDNGKRHGKQEELGLGTS